MSPTLKTFVSFLFLTAFLIQVTPTLASVSIPKQLPLTHKTKSSAPPREAQYHTLPSLRESARLQDEWTRERIEGIPGILRRWGVGAWLMSQREYAEDTAFWSLKSAKQFSARRRTVNLFIAEPKDGMPSAYTWIDNTPQVYTDLAKVLETHDPKTIVLNTNLTVSFASGLHVGEFEALKEHLGSKWSSRFVDEPMVAVEYISYMGKSKSKLEWYRKMQETAWAMITEAFSERVIRPGRTSTEDVEWWLRSKIQEQNFTTWFHPDVTIIGSDFGSSDGIHSSSLTNENARDVIQYGDMLHVDFGLTALGMNTDTQHLAYVVPPSRHSPSPSSPVPPALQSGLTLANRAQDILLTHLRPGLTGNTVLSLTLSQMAAENITGKIYCHPIGDWGHSAGTVIGMTNLQGGVPGVGELPVLEGGWWSVELSVEVEGQSFYQEEDVYWDEGMGRWEWVWGRQESFHLVRFVEEEFDGEEVREQVEL